MNQEPPIVLVLLTLRQLGSRSVPAKQDLFTKGLKKELEAAIAKGYVEKSKLIVQATGPNGKPKKSSIDILNMTSSGETALKQGANFEAFAATASADLAAKSLVELDAWKARLEQDRQSFRAVILTAAKSSSVSFNVTEKEIAALSKSVRDLAVKLENIEKKLLGNTSDREQLLTKIDEGIARLNETAGKINQVETKHATSREVPPAVSQAHDLKAIIRQAYKDLCEEVEYEDGSVPLPRLYYQARSVLPGLTVEALHRELLTLWQSQMLDLSVANEVRGIIEPDKAIKIDDNTYYFVKWRNK